MLKQLCLEKFVDDERRIGDVVVDDVSTDQKIKEILPQEPLCKPIVERIFSSKGRKKGMQARRSTPERRFKSVEELNRLNNTTMLSKLRHVKDSRIIRVLFNNVETIPQLLKVVDRIMINQETKEHCRSMIITAIERMEVPYFAQNKFFVKIAINDCVLFIETTPRALVFVAKSNPSQVVVANYDGNVGYIEVDPKIWESNSTDIVDIHWTFCGRYIYLSLDAGRIYVFDTYLGKIVENKTDNFYEGKFGNNTAKMLYSNMFMAIPEIPSLRITSHQRYWFKDTQLSHVGIGFTSKELQNHQKFKIIMGLN